MAELLIRTVDKTHSDPVKSLAGCFKRGDIICIQDDGHGWSEAERNADDRTILKIPKVEKNTLGSYMLPVYDEDPDVNPDATVVIQRKYKINLDSLGSDTIDSGTFSSLVVDKEA